MSPRERTYVAADSSEERSLGIAGTIALFAVFAVPVGMLLSSIQTQRQVRVEQAAFRRIGMDWEKRFQYPK